MYYVWMYVYICVYVYIYIYIYYIYMTNRLLNTVWSSLLKTVDTARMMNRPLHDTNTHTHTHTHTHSNIVLLTVKLNRQIIESTVVTWVTCVKHRTQCIYFVHEYAVQCNTEGFRSWKLYKKSYEMCCGKFKISVPGSSVTHKLSFSWGLRRSFQTLTLTRDKLSYKYILVVPARIIRS